MMKYLTLLIITILTAGCMTPETARNNTMQKPKKFTGNIFEQVANEFNKEDHKVNLAEAKCAEALNDLLSRDVKLRAALNEKLTAENDKTIALSTFLKSTRTLNDFNRSLGNETTLQELEKDLQYAGVHYYFEVFTLSQKITNQDNYYLGFGDEVNDDDEILGLSGRKVYLLNEKFANQNTVYLLSFATDEIATSETTEDPWNEESNRSRSSNNYEAIWDQCRIKNGHRYERNGDSDVAFYISPYEYPNCGGVSYVYNIAPDNYPQGLTPHFYRNDLHLKSISKNSVQNSDLLSINVPMIALPEDPLADYPKVHTLDHFLYITVYERDWSRSKKSVQGCSIGGNCLFPLVHEVRMKYINEWYYLDFCGFGFQNSNVGDMFAVNNNKCTLRMMRTN